MGLRLYSPYDLKGIYSTACMFVNLFHPSSSFAHVFFFSTRVCARVFTCMLGFFLLPAVMAGPQPLNMLQSIIKHVWLRGSSSYQIGSLRSYDPLPLVLDCSKRTHARGFEPQQTTIHANLEMERTKPDCLKFWGSFNSSHTQTSGFTLRQDK